MNWNECMHVPIISSYFLPHWIELSSQTASSHETHPVFTCHFLCCYVTTCAVYPVFYPFYHIVWRDWNSVQAQWAPSPPNQIIKCQYFHQSALFCCQDSVFFFLIPCWLSSTKSHPFQLWYPATQPCESWQYVYFCVDMFWNTQCSSALYKHIKL